MIAPDFDIAGGIPRVLCELSGRVGLNDCSAQALWKTDPLSINSGPGVTKQVQRSGIVLEVDANLFKNALGIGFHQYQLFFAG
jgi:hypothetical protein